MIDGNETLARLGNGDEAEAKLEALSDAATTPRPGGRFGGPGGLANDRSLGDFKTLLFQRRSALTAKDQRTFRRTCGPAGG